MFKPWSDFFIHATIVARSLGTRNFVSSWELRVERLSRNLLSLRELLSRRSCLAKVGSLSSLCHGSRFLGAIRIISHRIGQLCAGSRPFGVKALDWQRS